MSRYYSSSSFCVCAAFLSPSKPQQKHFLSISCFRIKNSTLVWVSIYTSLRLKLSKLSFASLLSPKKRSCSELRESYLIICTKTALSPPPFLCTPATLVIVASLQTNKPEFFCFSHSCYVLYVLFVIVICHAHHLSQVGHVNDEDDKNDSCHKKLPWKDRRRWRRLMPFHNYRHSNCPPVMNKLSILPWGPKDS